MPSYATPGVYFESADQAQPQISAVRTDITAFIGVAQMGPLDSPTPVQSWQQFQSVFGNFLPNAYLAYAAKAFFENGGAKLYVVRVAAPPVTTASAGAQPADGSSSIVASVDGFAAGAVATASQDLIAQCVGVQPADRASSLVDTVAGFTPGAIVQLVQTVPVPIKAWQIVAAVDAVAKRLTWNEAIDPRFQLASPIALQAPSQQDLLISSVDASAMRLTWQNALGPVFDLTQPLTIASGAQPASGILYGADGNPTLRIDAASPGVWGGQIEVVVSPTSLAATRTAGTQPSSGEFSLTSSVAGFPVRSLVRIFQSSPLKSGYRTVTNVDPSTNLLKWDTPLAPAFDVTQTLSLETVEFALTVSAGGTPKEIFTGLSLDPAHPRYVGNAVTSAYIVVTDLKSTGPIELRQPDPSAPQLNQGELTLSGGRDGIAALRAINFIGDAGSATKTGLRTLEDVDEVDILAAPDILIEPTPAVLRSPLPPPPPNPCCGPLPAPGVAAPAAAVVIEASPAFSLDAIFAVQQALVQQCETILFRFAILDSPAFGYPSQRIDLAEVQSWRERFDTEFAALYLPWIFVRDPIATGSQIVRRIPPSGHVAGVYANTDLTVGVHKAPANIALDWAQDLTSHITPELQGVLNPMGVDCLRPFPGRGLRVYGARTMSSDASWRFVPVRRLVSMIEHALLISLQWAVFEPNNAILRQKITAAVNSFLEAIWSRGGLSGNTAADAFYVRCDATNNPPAAAQLGQLIVEIGVAPAIPAEFVIFRIGRSEDTLEVTEL